MSRGYNAPIDNEHRKYSIQFETDSYECYKIVEKMYQTVRCTTYCFEAKLKYIGEDKYYFVPFQVLAEDRYTAESILWKYLENPDQTGYKYETCVHIQSAPSSQIIVDSNTVLNSIKSGEIIR